MTTEALTPAAAPKRCFDDFGLDSCAEAKRYKRGSDDEDLAGCRRVALRRGGETSSSSAEATPSPTTTRSSPSQIRIHECNVCGKRFASHQALGGHKASHRSKPQSNGADEGNPSNSIFSAAKGASNCASTVPGPHRLHKCSTCGKSFPTGQALGGHMRKHYNGVIGSKSGVNSSDSSNGNIGCSYGDGGDGEMTAVAHALDLNLPPPQELDLTLRL